MDWKAYSTDVWTRETERFALVICEPTEASNAVSSATTEQQPPETSPKLIERCAPGRRMFKACTQIWALPVAVYQI